MKDKSSKKKQILESANEVSKRDENSSRHGRHKPKATSQPKNVVSYCPECDARMTVAKRPTLDMMVQCRECRTKLIVVDLAPLTLDWPSEDDDE